MKKIFILGSCVTRDAFELDIAQKYQIVNYLARTSIASTFCFTKIEDHIDLSNITSSFQKRMIENDFFKRTSAELERCDFDFLIMDFIDERFELFLTEKKSLFTLSSEFTSQVVFDIEGHKIKPNTDEFFQYWCSGWDYFIDFAKEHNFLHKIILNKVYWTNEVSGGGTVFPIHNKRWIDQQNQWLNKLYQYVEKKGGVRFFSYTVSDLQADREHKWGVQPYHYHKEFYNEFVKQLDCFSQGVHLTLEPLSIDSGIEDLLSKGRVLTFCKCNNELEIELHITIASDQNVGNKDLLYSVQYYPQISDEEYCSMGYNLSASSEIGYFKYIPTKKFSIYNYKIPIYLKDNTNTVSIKIQSFYPLGKSVILDIEAYTK